VLLFFCFIFVWLYFMSSFFVLLHVLNFCVI
jgi:hypothetical protein